MVSSEERFSDVTPQAAFRPLIRELLLETGGGRSMHELLRVAEGRLKGKLRAGDYNGLTGGEIRWRNAMRWERNAMAKEGLIKRGSPKGWWELTEDGSSA